MKNNNRAPLPGYLAGLEPLSRRGFLRTSVLAGAALSSGCSSLFGRREALKPSSTIALPRMKSR